MFANNYLHKVDSDKLPVCEAYSTILKDPALKTPKAGEIINNLSLEQFFNVVAKPDGHQVTLNVSSLIEVSNNFILLLSYKTITL